jgi:hypothetical protein
MTRPCFTGGGASIEASSCEHAEDRKRTMGTFGRTVRSAPVRDGKAYWFTMFSAQTDPLASEDEDVPMALALIGLAAVSFVSLVAPPAVRMLHSPHGTRR